MSDLTELLQDLNIEFREHGSHHHTSFGWINIDCPDCSPHSGSYRLGIHTSSLAASCWACGPKRLAECLRTYSPDAPDWRLLRRFAENDTDVVFDRRRRRRRSVRLPSDVMKSLTGRHCDILEDRGFDLDEVERLWGIRSIGPLGKAYAHNIFIPIHHRGEIISWTTRSSAKNPMTRYLSADKADEVYEHKSLVYGLDYVGNTVIVVEGPTDVWSLGPGAVCTFGSAYTAAQVEILQRIPNRFICYDKEKGAQEQAEKLCSELCIFPGNTDLIELETGKDPADCSEKERRQLQKLLKG